MSLNKTIINKLNNLKETLDIIDRDLTYEEVLLDTKLTTHLSKEKSIIEPIVNNYIAWQKSIRELSDLSEDDKTTLGKEIDVLNENIYDLENNLIDMLSKMDAKKQEVTIEIIPIKMGNGKLYDTIIDMYINICEIENFDYEKISDNSTLLNITGNNVLDIFSQENGVHKSSLQSIKVIVYPKINKKEFTIDDSNVRIDAFRAEGAGGQNINKVSTAIRLTHLPTGMVVVCQDERSQFQNRERAFKILQAKLTQKTNKDYLASLQQARKKANNDNIIKIYDFDKNTILFNNNDTTYPLDTYINGEIVNILKSNLE